MNAPALAKEIGELNKKLATENRVAWLTTKDFTKVNEIIKQRDEVQRRYEMTINRRVWDVAASVD